MSAGASSAWQAGAWRVVATRNAGGGLRRARSVRHYPFENRLLDVSARAGDKDADRIDYARPAGHHGFASGVRSISRGSGGFDQRCAANSAATYELGGHRISRPAARADEIQRRRRQVPRLHWADLAGEAAGPRD